jgi:hypothetical protein
MTDTFVAVDQLIWTIHRRHDSFFAMSKGGAVDPSEWGTSEINRKAKFYAITKRGLKPLALETENWERISGAIGRVTIIADRG